MYKIFFLNKKKAMQPHVCIAFFIQDTPSVFRKTVAYYRS